MEEELDMNEGQNEEIVEEVVSTDDTATTTIATDEVLPLAPTSDGSPYAATDETTSYVGDEDTTNDSEEESSEDKWGSLDCRSECKYNTGSTYKYANYGYSD